jgi:hypothetical protein
MTTTTTTKEATDMNTMTAVSPLPEYQPLHRSKTREEFLCKDCSSLVMWKVSNNTGKTYLAVEVSIYGETGRHIKTIYPAHKCVPTLEAQAAHFRRKEAIANANANAIAAGEIVRGALVVVTKGRKYPKGLSGEVFWVAPEEDKYGVIKVGFKTASYDENKPEGDGESFGKVYINIENIEAIARKA